MGLSIYGSNIGATKCSLFFGSRKTVRFQPLLMDRFITVDFKYSLSHDTASLHSICQWWFATSWRCSKQEGIFSSRAGTVFCNALDLSLQPPPEHHMKGTSIPHKMAFFIHLLSWEHYCTRALNIMGTMTMTLQVGLDHPMRVASRFLQWPGNGLIIIIHFLAWEKARVPCY